MVAPAIASGYSDDQLCSQWSATRSKQGCGKLWIPLWLPLWDHQLWSYRGDVPGRCSSRQAIGPGGLQLWGVEIFGQQGNPTGRGAHRDIPAIANITQILGCATGSPALHRRRSRFEHRQRRQRRLSAPHASKYKSSVIDSDALACKCTGLLTLQLQQRPQFEQQRRSECRRLL